MHGFVPLHKTCCSLFMYLAHAPTSFSKRLLSVQGLGSGCGAHEIFEGLRPSCVCYKAPGLGNTVLLEIAASCGAVHGSSRGKGPTCGQTSTEGPTPSSISDLDPAR